MYSQNHSQNIIDSETQILSPSFSPISHFSLAIKDLQQKRVPRGWNRFMFLDFLVGGEFYDLNLDFLFGDECYGFHLSFLVGSECHGFHLGFLVGGECHGFH